MILDSTLITDILPGTQSIESRFKSEVLKDFWICLVSREVSILGRREVLTGKAKFGILGDGKEVPQVAMARAFEKGDHRAGYYRDQTLMFALGLCSVEDFFAQLYADPENDPFSGGRQMNNHFATPYIDPDGDWIDQRNHYNISSDLSCTAGQVGRALGLALASKLYRESKDIEPINKFSDHGNEVCFCTIGDGSTSEGAFWEVINAANVMRVPLAMSVWDDGYGISVPVELQTVKGSISKALEGFLLDEKMQGMRMYKVKAWDYPTLCTTYERMINLVRRDHIPALIHVVETTQPQGHSTSGSHERYKSKERLRWEKEYDCIEKMAEWMIATGIAEESLINSLRQRAKEYVRAGKNKAWSRYCSTAISLTRRLKEIYTSLKEKKQTTENIHVLGRELGDFINPHFSEVVQNGRKLSVELWKTKSELKSDLDAILENSYDEIIQRYNTNLYSGNQKSALKVPIVPPFYSEHSKMVNGFKILNENFKIAFNKYPELVAFGEDVGKIGDVNQGFAGLQQQFGENRIFDTGIREWSIVGKGIGLSMRGLRPIAEIQYLDYLVYGMAPLTDDLATIRYRSNGIQRAPAIIRTRGHRLEGIWHAGSPMGMIINSLRGIYVLVPRNMVQAAGFYNTMLQSDDPALIIECLNGYRLKEKMPVNIGEYTVPLGMPEILQVGNDLSLITYGSCVRVAQEAIQKCNDIGISIELIDVQTLLPFDLEQIIVSSLKKTNRILFLDEDVPGGATAFMMQKVLEEQGGYKYLDSAPITITASNHRPPYGTDGDYFSKPNAEDVFKRIANLMLEDEPKRFKT